MRVSLCTPRPRDLWTFRSFLIFASGSDFGGISIRKKGNIFLASVPNNYIIITIVISVSSGFGPDYKVSMRREEISIGRFAEFPFRIRPARCFRMSFPNMFFANFSLFLVLSGSKEIYPRTPCPPPVFSRHGTARCRWGLWPVSCGRRLPPGTVAEFACRDFFESSEGKTAAECRSNGTWNATAPECIPDCGRRGGATGLVVKGAVASSVSFPWHVALYNFLDGHYEYWCGGTLVSDVAVLTAAHCVWEVPPDNLMLVFGKFHREYDFVEINCQRRKVEKVELLSSYQDAEGNYNGDVAVMRVREPVELSAHVAPACVDWEQELVEVQVSEGGWGVVAGWGLTENETFSDLLRSVALPVVSDEQCIAAQQPDFRKFVTHSSFCAGFGNGTGVCNGDSGGGLAFFDSTSARWYLQGLVSVSPRKNGTPYCDLNFYTVFTKVAIFAKWLKRVLEPHVGPDGGPPRKDFSSSEGKTANEFGHYVKTHKINYTHTPQMLYLAQLHRP